MHLIYLFPLLLGMMMLFSLYKPLSWMARWGIAYTVGMAAGLRAYGVLNSNVIGQVKNTIIPVVGTDLPFFSLTGDSYFNNLIIKDLGKSFKPDKIIFVKDLPKTRNMKIMRRVIKSCLVNQDPGDISTLLNPESVEEIKQHGI